MIILYDFFLEYLSTPAAQVPTANGIQVTGCQFKFHRNMSKFSSFAVFDSTKALLKELQTNVTSGGDVDLYQLTHIIIKSYSNIGNFFKCKLYDSSVMNVAIESDFSSFLQVIGK